MFFVAVLFRLIHFVDYVAGNCFFFFFLFEGMTDLIYEIDLLHVQQLMRYLVLNCKEFLKYVRPGKSESPFKKD